MPWFKVDDGLPSSRKVLGIPRRDRLAAIGLWTLAGAWSAKELQDGAVPSYMIVELGATRRVAEALVTVGLWSRTSSGYSFVNWDDFQPTKADVLSAREKNAEKLRKWRQRNRDRDQGETKFVTELQDGSDEVRNAAPVPARPDPTSPPIGGEDVADRADVVELCELLADLVEQNGSNRPPVTKTWRDSARLLLDRDGRELESAKRLVRWSQADDFWRSNVLSMPTFRKQYDRLRLAANRQLEERRQAPGRGGQRDAELIGFMTGADNTPTRQEITQ
ncbi:hypothetical protein [Curtobacterium sp. CFBP9011]|uniref:hypothetical protein n=1 Tax=Curtobacterium sp. CFBP9011 TaxID=3096530 RepID=UPI002A6AB599|nr:hypothetical protein [Curtobacterium sp. CFBP9011]MDY1005723.1 hypothetical protein [Curtobacterium sp. CFBP9011]